MRKSKAETAKTRERILEAASAQFLSHGITEAGLAQLMRAAGLTHAVSTAISLPRISSFPKPAVRQHSRSPPGSNPNRGEAPDQALPLLVASIYPQPQDRPAIGCVLPHSGVNWRARMPRHVRPLPKASWPLPVDCGQLKNVPAKKAEVQSMAIAAAMIGAVTVARIVPDSRISNSVLVGTRDHILKSVRRKR